MKKEEGKTITYTIIAVWSGKPAAGLDENMNEQDMRSSAKIFGFKKARIDKLVNHTSKNYICLRTKDYELYKNFSV